MANRYNTRNVQTLSKAPVKLYVYANIGSSGAPTLIDLKSLGILSISRSASGKYTINFGGPAGVDTYIYLMSTNFSFIGASGAASTVAAVSVLADNSANSSAPGINIECLDYAGSAVDPDDGEVMLAEITVSNTTAI